MPMKTWAFATVPGLVLSLLLTAACAGGQTSGFHPETTEAGRTVAGGIEYVAETEQLAGDTLRTRITATNRSEAPVDLTVPGGCTVLVRAYATAARSGEAVWDQGAALKCTMELRIVRLEPGASESFASPPFSPSDMRGAGVAAGRVHLTGVINPEGGRVELAAGALDL
jgi:hypothetical protein